MDTKVYNAGSSGGVSGPQVNFFLWPQSNIGLLIMCCTIVAVTAIICFS